MIVADIIITIAMVILLLFIINRDSSSNNNGSGGNGGNTSSRVVVVLVVVVVVLVVPTRTPGRLVVLRVSRHVKPLEQATTGWHTVPRSIRSVPRSTRWGEHPSLPGNVRFLEASDGASIHLF